MQRTPTPREKLMLSADRLSEHEAGEVLEYISVMQTLNDSTKRDALDEFVAALVFESFARAGLH